MKNSKCMPATTTCYCTQRQEGTNIRSKERKARVTIDVESVDILPATFQALQKALIW